MDVEEDYPPDPFGKLYAKWGLIVWHHTAMLRVAMFDVIKIENAGAPFQHDDAKVANDYSCFDKVANEYGVYVFESTINGQVLYVGQASKQSLKKRITQNYTQSNTGGTFRDNWCKAEKKNFEDFRQMLSATRIKIICFPESTGALICAIEAILISALCPQYNNLASNQNLAAAPSHE